jgi:Raf kinase inhibitor-like YbhB/YbcL family protein
MDIKISSPAFQEGASIPSKYTCDGDDVSPPLIWEPVPDARSFVLICDDPDAPMGTWVHWVLYNLPPDGLRLEENIPAQERLDNGALQGMNDFRRIGYGGPCPPSGEHRYFFKLYALDHTLELEAGATKAQVMIAMEGHVRAQGHLMGRYRR